MYNYTSHIADHIATLYSYYNNKVNIRGSRTYKADFAAVQSLYALHHNCEDISALDMVADAICHKSHIGIGTKTTIKLDSFEKVCEIRHEDVHNVGTSAEQLVANIRNKFNERLSKVIQRYNLQECKYHVVFVDQKYRKFYFREFPMCEISEDCVISMDPGGKRRFIRKKTLFFRDQKNNVEYHWMRSKSTLKARFCIGEKINGYPIPLSGFSQGLLDLIKSRDEKLYSECFKQIIADSPYGGFCEINMIGCSPERSKYHRSKRGYIESGRDVFEEEECVTSKI